MRELSINMISATSQRVTKPGYLIELQLAQTTFARLSSAGDVNWNDHTWTGNRSVNVSGVSDRSASVSIGNVDSAFSALVLNNDLIGRRAKIWAVDARATDANDPVLVFEGVIDASDVAMDKISMTFVTQSAGVLWSPRRMINAASGFNHLIPAGTQLKIGNTTLTLERRR